MIRDDASLKKEDGWNVSFPWKFDLWTVGSGEGIRFEWDAEYGWFNISTLLNEPIKSEDGSMDYECHEIKEEYQGNIEPLQFCTAIRMLMGLIETMEPKIRDLLKAERKTNG